MSQDNQDKPVDVFANLGMLLDDKPAQKKPQPKPEEGRYVTPEKQMIQPDMQQRERIRELAAESQFQSRQTAPKKKKILSKTFSLHQEEYDVIGQGIRHYSNHIQDAYSLPSGSDVVRAALHVFSMQSPELQAELIRTHRARGK